MAEADKVGAGEEGSRKKHKAVDRNSEEPHVMSDAAPKLEELAPNGGSKTERAEGDSAMAIDDAKSGSKANGAEGAEGESAEGKQDLKKIEDEFTQLKEKFFAEKLAAIKVEIEQIELGAHEGINSETKILESKKIRRMALAEQIHRYQVNSIDASLRADMKCAEDDYSAESKDLREKTLRTLNKKKKELEEEKRDFTLADTADNQRATTRTLRKRGQAKEPDVPVPAPSTTSSDYPKKVPELRVRLTDEEMDSDMAQIQKGIINM